MPKTNRTPLEKIQTLKTKKLARIFFGYFMTCGFATRLLHEKKWKDCREKNRQGYVMGYIRNCFNEWKEAGFIEKSPFKLKFIIKHKKLEAPIVSKKPFEPFVILKNYGYRLNLKPFYLYCEEPSRNIDFTKDEKKLLNYIFRSQTIREQVLRENPDKDIITAILIYYIKHFALPHNEFGDKEERKLLTLAEKDIKKDFEEEFYKENETFLMDFEISREYEKMTKKQKEKFWEIKRFKTYALLYKYHRKEFQSINTKFKKALGILP